jgi:GAF domain-containing protein/HAMP domain-containing protein
MGLPKSFRNVGLGVKIMTAVFLALLALLIAVTIVVSTASRRLTVQMGQNRLEQEAAVIRNRFELAEQDTMASTKLLASRPGLIEAVASQDATAIRMTSLVGAAPLDLDEIDVAGPDGAYIATMLEAGGTLHATQQAPLISLALLGIESTGAIVDEEEGALWLAAAVPLRDVSGTIAGALLATRRVDDAFLAERNFYRGDIHLALVAKGRILAQDFPSPELLGEASAVLLDRTALEQAQSGRILIADDLFRSSDGAPYAVAYSPFVVHDDTVATIDIMVDMGQLRIFERQWTITTAIIFTVLALVALFGVGVFVRAAIARPIRALTSVTERMASGDYRQRAQVTTADEIGQLAGAFNRMATQLQQTLAGLEQRTADLQQRTTQLQTSAEVSHTIVSIMDVDQLLHKVVDLVYNRFDLYYVGLFLVDQSGEWAVLQTGSGEVGQAMVARGHRIRVGQGLIGQSIASAEPCLASDTGEDAAHLATAELPDTRSEAALPMRSRGRVIGALALQSDQPAAFGQNTIAVWQMMADQLAVALDNAQLLATAQAALEAERRAYGEIVRQAWAGRLAARPDWGYDYEQKSLAPAHGGWTPEMRRAAQTGHQVLAVADDAEGNDRRGTVLAIPLKVRDSVVGVLSYRKDESGGAWAAEEMELLETFTSQLSVALESARLYQDTQRREARERTIREIADQMQRASDMEALLRITADGLNRALGGSRTYVRLSSEAQLGEDA